MVLPEGKRTPRTMDEGFFGEQLGSDFKINVFNREVFAGKDEDQPNPDRVLILLAGTSESGKSHFGKHFFESKTGNKLKFYKLLRLTSGYQPWSETEESPDPFKYAHWLAERPRERLAAFREVFGQVEEIEDESRCTISSMETIKHPWIVEAFRSLPNTKVISVFIDAPLDARVQREALKTQRPVAEIHKRTVSKDAEKDEYGNEGVRNGADLVVINGGTVHEYNRFVERFETFCGTFANGEFAVPLDNMKREVGHLFATCLESLPRVEAIRKTLGVVLFKPDALELDVHEFLLHHMADRLRKRGAAMVGIVDNMPPMTREAVAAIYHELEGEYLGAYTKVFGENGTIVVFFEGLTTNIDIWEEIRKLKGKLTKGNGIEDSIRAMVPLPGDQAEFKRVSAKIASGEPLNSTDYHNLTRNLVHAPDTMGDFNAIVNLIADEQLSVIFGQRRARALREFVNQN